MADSYAQTSAPARERTNNRTFALGIAAIVFALDQITKWIVISPLRLREQGMIDLFPFFDLRWVENRGVSMGLLTADSNTGRWFLVAMTAAISIGVLVWLWREKSRGDALALSLVLGGALGLAVAPAGVSVMAQLTPCGFPVQTSSILDLRLLAFAFVVSIATGVVFSLVPAMLAARASLSDAIQHGARSAVGGRGRFTRDALVVL